MKVLIVSLVALAVTTAIILSGMQDPGLVVLNWANYKIRLPLLLFVVFIVIGFLMLHLLLGFIGSILRAPKKYKDWRNQHSRNVAHKHTMLGYAGLIEGDWKKAEKELQVKLEYNNTPLLNYLGAAYAAQQQGDHKRRDHYLDEASKKFPRHQFSINLTRARLLFRNSEYVEAKKYLQKLIVKKPKNLPTLRLLADTYEQLEQWSDLVKLIPSLKKTRALPKYQLKQKEHLVYEKFLSDNKLLSQNKRDNNLWQSLPKKIRSDSYFVAIYARRLIMQNAHKEAEKILRYALQRSYDSELIKIYGNVNSCYLDYQIQLAEKFLSRYAQSAELHHTLAKLYQSNKDYQQAVHFYEKSLEFGNNDAVFYMDYALLLEQLGQQSRALFYLKKSSASAVDVTEQTAETTSIKSAAGPALPSYSDEIIEGEMIGESQSEVPVK